ncbi:MAG: CoA transferase [Alphaproteobacteria bacterium]
MSDKQSNGSGKGPLSGIRVLDFSMFMAGPYASRLLADGGAEVIKVEPPGGEFMRKSNPLRGAYSGFFGHLNCGKKCITLNLKDPRDLAVIHALMPSVDVVLENFRPGVTARLGIHYDDLSKLRSDLVYCSVSGYGQTGPAAQLPAYAPIIHAASGVDLSLTEYALGQDQPVPNRSTAADILAATHAFGAICAALVHRQRGGGGDYIDVSLMDTMYHMMGYEVQTAQIDNPPRPITFGPTKTRDGFIIIAPISQLNFEALARAAQHPEWLRDERFSTVQGRFVNWETMMAEVAKWAIQHDADACVEALSREGCPCTKYMTVAEAIAQPQAAHRGSLAEVEDGWGRYRVPDSPFKFTKAEVKARSWVAEIGQHDEEVRAELNLPEKSA